MPKSSIAELTGFRNPQYYPGKESYIAYYVINPAEQNKGFQRKRIKLNHIRDPKERRRYATFLCHQIQYKLAHGWNPFLEQEAPRAFTPMIEVMQSFLVAKTKELRANSIRTYRTLCFSIIAYLERSGRPQEYCINFTRNDAMNLMRELSADNEISSRTYNNRIAGYRIIFNWAVEQQFIKVNPFTGIKKMTVQGKTRVIITPEWLAAASDWLEVHSPSVLFAARHVFHMLVRPEEITKLRPELYNLNSQTLLIPASIAKNKKDNTVTIPNHMVPVIREYFDKNRILQSQYIWGQDLRPGAKPINPRRLAKVWNRMRMAIGMPENMQFYSLKDTGIVSLLRNGVSIHSVKNQARHSNVSETSAYLPYAKDAADPAIRSIDTGF